MINWQKQKRDSASERENNEKKAIFNYVGADIAYLNCLERMDIASLNVKAVAVCNFFSNPICIIIRFSDVSTFRLLLVWPVY